MIALMKAVPSQISHGFGEPRATKSVLRFHGCHERTTEYRDHEPNCSSAEQVERTSESVQWSRVAGALRSLGRYLAGVVSFRFQSTLVARPELYLRVPRPNRVGQACWSGSVNVFSATRATQTKRGARPKREGGRPSL